MWKCIGCHIDTQARLVYNATHETPWDSVGMCRWGMGARGYRNTPPWVPGVGFSQTISCILTAGAIQPHPGSAWACFWGPVWHVPPQCGVQRSLGLPAVTVWSCHRRSKFSNLLAPSNRVVCWHALKGSWIMTPGLVCGASSFLYLVQGKP